MGYMSELYTETLEDLLKNKGYGLASQDATLTEILNLMGKFPKFVFGQNIELNFTTLFIQKFDIREIGAETEELFLHFWREKTNELLIKYVPKITMYIYEAAVVDNSEIPDFMYADKKSETDDKTCFGTVHADVYAPGIRFSFRLSAGSEVNIKPELVLDAFLEFCGLEHDEFAFQIHRANMYSDVGAVLGL